MTILQLSSEKYFRGGERQIALLIDELNKLGVHNIVAARRGSEFSKYCAKNNIECFELGFRNAFDLVTASSIKKICSTRKVDIVHIHSAKSHGIAVIAASLGNKTPLILSRRVAFIPKNSFLTKWKYNHPAIRKIVCVSNRIKEIMQAYAQRPERCVTVYSGIDLKKFDGIVNDGRLRKEYNISDSTTLIGNTAALEKEKDLFTFIKTISILIKDDMDVKGVVIGDGSLQQELTEFSRSLNVESSIIFTGYRNDVRECLAGLNIFMITSEEEGLGTSVLDAFAAGVPVVATNAGGIPEMVIHERTGLLADIKNAQHLAENVKRLMTNDALKKSLTINAKENLLEFSKEEMARKTLDVYKLVASAD